MGIFFEASEVGASTRLGINADGVHHIDHRDG
jgi:hypothetical protein